MRLRIAYLGIAVALLAPPLGHAGEVIDRIVATVNGHIILQSQWDERVSYEAFVDHRPPDNITTEQRKAALDRLIDQELIRQQTRPAALQPPASAEINSRISDIRKQYPGASDETGWPRLLAQYGLTEGVLRQEVAAEFDELHAVDAHLRPGVQVDSRSVESYYREKLLPELRAKGAAQVPLAEVAPEIKEILAQQKLNDLLIAWLRSLRGLSEIHTPFATSAPEGRDR